MIKAQIKLIKELKEGHADQEDVKKAVIALHRLILEDSYGPLQTFESDGLLLVDECVFPLKSEMLIYTKPYFVLKASKDKLVLLSVEMQICDLEVLKKQQKDIMEALIEQLSIWDTQQKLKLAKENNYHALITLWEKDFAEYKFKDNMNELLEKNDLNAMQVQIVKMKTFVKINKLIESLKECNEEIVENEYVAEIQETILNANQTYKENGISLVWVPFK